MIPQLRGVFLHERKELASRAVYIDDRKNNFSRIWRCAFGHFKAIKAECSNICMAFKNLHRPRLAQDRGSHLGFPKHPHREAYNRSQRKHSRNTSLNRNSEEFSGIPALPQLSREVLSRSSKFSASNSSSVLKTKI